MALTVTQPIILDETGEKIVAAIEEHTSQLTNIMNADVMVGASANVSGKSGRVPAPAAGKENAFLKGDGTWGSAEITGYVKWVKDTNTTTNRTTTEYYVKLRDTGSHGFKDEVAEKDVSRAKIFTEGAVAITAPTTPGTPYPCTLK